jgi:hypothetical protein
MAENRLARELETRETTQRKQQWAPAQLLPTPTPQPGWAFRWVRTAIMGVFDPTNTSAKFREGWVPCKSEDHPEMQVYADPNSKFKGNIEIGGLLLCKIPQEFMDQRAAHYRRANDNQIEAVDNSFMKTSNPKMPLFSERKSSTTFGRGAK